MNDFSTPNSGSNSHGKNIFIVAALVLIAGGIVYALAWVPRESSPVAIATPPPVADVAPLQAAATPPPPTTTAKFSGAVLGGSAVSPVIDFNEVDYKAALVSKKLIVLYFYANWCGECKAEVPVLYSTFNGLNNADIIAFRVNFNDSDTEDAEKELARSFGVAYQHTKVFLKNGQRILKSPETWNLARYAEEISKAIK